MRTTLDEIRTLEGRAVYLMRDGLQSEALIIIAEAIEKLQLMAADERDDTSGTEIQALLLVSHAIKASIHRRSEDLISALAEYRAAQIYEDPKSEVTFVLFNILTLTILIQPRRLNDGSLTGELEALTRRLEANLAGSNGDNWWHWVELFQISMLKGDVQGAKQAFKHVLASNPSLSVVQQALEFLGQMSRSLEIYQPELAKQISEFVSESQAVAAPGGWPNDA